MVSIVSGKLKLLKLFEFASLTFLLISTHVVDRPGENYQPENRYKVLRGILH